MSDILKRYRLLNGETGPYMHEWFEGEWVRYSAYETLATENAALRHDIDRHVKICSDQVEEIAKLRWQRDELEKLSRHYANCTDSSYHRLKECELRIEDILNWTLTFREVVGVEVIETPKEKGG